MKARVYHVTTPDNLVSWDSEGGKAYLDARYHQNYDAAQRLKLIKHVATVEAESAEDIWVKFQNGVDAHPENPVKIKSEIPYMRSLYVGDLVVWENGVVEFVAWVGFEETDFNPEIPVGLEKFQS